VGGGLFFSGPRRLGQTPTRSLAKPPPLLLLALILLFGWTVVGWFVAWWYAFHGAPSDSGWTPPETAPSFTTLGAGPAFSAAPAGPEAKPRAPCRQCSLGRERCPQCLGRGTWYEQPQSATASAVLVRCPYRSGSGTIQCRSCGGTGLAPAY